MLKLDFRGAPQTLLMLSLTLLPTDQGLKLTDFVNEVCVCVCTGALP